jgi:hypothetical protein
VSLFRTLRLWFWLSIWFAAVITVVGIAADAGVPSARALLGQLPKRPPAGPPPSPAARAEIPRQALTAYRAATRYCPGLSWAVLAGIGKVESDHGRSRAPGVHQGVNRLGCCAGPMQFNVGNGPPSTWQRYRVDADHDGTANPYNLDDAAAAAARLLCANGATRPGGLRSAVYAYNHAGWYVDEVLANAQRYQGRGRR